jgi:hypothetical protein
MAGEMVTSYRLLVKAALCYLANKTADFMDGADSLSGFRLEFTRPGRRGDPGGLSGFVQRFSPLG